MTNRTLSATASLALAQSLALDEHIPAVALIQLFRAEWEVYGRSIVQALKMLPQTVFEDTLSTFARVTAERFVLARPQAGLGLSPDELQGFWESVLIEMTKADRDDYALPAASQGNAPSRTNPAEPAQSASPVRNLPHLMVTTPPEVLTLPRSSRRIAFTADDLDDYEADARATAEDLGMLGRLLNMNQGELVDQFGKLGFTTSRTTVGSILNGTMVKRVRDGYPAQITPVKLKRFRQFVSNLLETATAPNAQPAQIFKTPQMTMQTPEVNAEPEGHLPPQSVEPQHVPVAALMLGQHVQPAHSETTQTVLIVYPDSAPDDTVSNHMPHELSPATEPYHRPRITVQPASDRQKLILTGTKDRVRYLWQMRDKGEDTVHVSALRAPFGLPKLAAVHNFLTDHCRDFMVHKGNSVWTFR